LVENHKLLIIKNYQIELDQLKIQEIL
jgi:hypothetical protein